MKVLYATDGFEPAIAAGALLQNLAHRDRIEVTVLSVTPTGIPAPEHLPLVLDPLLLRREDTIAIIDASIEKLRSAGFRATGRSAEGHPSREILEIIQKDSFDLTVMGSGNRTWLGAHLLGSVSTSLLHASPSSVLIVHEELGQRKRERVLVGADGSHGADLTIQTLAKFADPERAEVTVVSVVPFGSLPLVLAPVPGDLSPEARARADDLQEQAQARTMRCAERAATALRDAGFKAEARIAQGNPSEQLLKEAESGGFDLVAVGSRGLGPIRRTLLGSVSDNIVRRARAALVGRRLVS